MAQRIIDDLESVEIDEQHSESPIMASRRFDCEVQKLVEHHPIGQIRQAVMGRQMLDLLIRSRLFVGAIEIPQGERDIFRKSLEKLDQFRGECPGFAAVKSQNSNRFRVLEERERGGRERTVCLEAFSKQWQTRVVQIIV